MLPSIGSARLLQFPSDAPKFPLGRRWAAVAAEPRHCPRLRSYPVATRVQETTKTFGNRPPNTRFGTEGSEVRILSPRPNLQRNDLVDKAHPPGGLFLLSDEEAAAEMFAMPPWAL